MRDRAFNPARRAIQASADPAGGYTPSLAAMLIFLNRTGYNGLFRVNARGEFNVPAGRYGNPRICDEANLRAWSAALGRPGVSLEVSAFDAALAAAGQGDFIYLDPPYAPLSGTARFTSYTAGGFDAVQQEALQRTVIALAARGASVLLSNSAAPQIRRFTPAAARLGSPASARRPWRPAGPSIPGPPAGARSASTSLRTFPGVNYWSDSNWRVYVGHYHPPDRRDLYPGLRLGVCRVPGLRAERADQGQGHGRQRAR